MPRPTKVTADLKDVQKMFDGLELNIKRAVQNQLGESIVNKMKDLIQKGISPIDGDGRFPEYASQRESAQLVEKQKKHQKASRSTAAKIISAYKKRQKEKAKEYKNAAEKKASKFYPLDKTTQKNFPEKKQRPVNLRLSGKFLDSLTYVLGIDGFSVNVGFFDKYSITLEKGHREQTNNQGYRPIIPKGNEKLARLIYLEALKVIKNSITKKV